MLTRLMFLYFIQHKGFLDNDTNYLLNHLKMTQNRKGIGLDFYRDFLLILFHEGLSKQTHPPEYTTFLGNVPFLNIDLFKKHEIERDNSSSTIEIPDEAFERVFSFFNTYCWKLDDHPPRYNNDINPDVLGYIFEKHIDQKQTGAYYTQRNVTEYIAKTTIIPILFDIAEQNCPGAFCSSGSTWQLLRENPDHYIYPAVKKGIELPLPSEITPGLNDVSRRSTWNHPATDEYALPTESWREVIARRQRYQAMRAKLETGAIHSINDFITYNLNMRQFAQDVIESCTEPKLLQVFHKILANLTVLDPTCGSGAFLFAALDILEPLYIACIDRLAQLESRKESSYSPGGDQQPNHPYSILKSIVTSNLFGVDIMEEATEICKLRLYLKLLTQIEHSEAIEPLPDLDDNIRTGNAFTGFTRQADTYTHSEQKSSSDKRDIEARELWSVNSPDPACPSQENLPFHWFVEFPHVMHNDGFNVIIGNPPYVEYEKLSRTYKLMNYTTLPTGNLFALTMERCASLLAPGGRFGMIVPASATCTDGYLPLQKILLEQSTLYISSFSDQRGKLFDIPHPRLCIITYQKHPGAKSVFSTPYLKLGRELREYLFQRLDFIEVTKQVQPGIIPRYGSLIEQAVHAKLYGQSQRLGDYLCKTGSHKLYYTRKLSWFVQVTPFIPKILDEQGREREPSELKTLHFSSPEHADMAFVALNSNLFYWFITTRSDCRNLNMREVLGLPFSIDKIPVTTLRDLRKLATKLAEDLQIHSEMKRMNFNNIGTLTIQCLFPGKSKPIIDEIERMLAQHYGFTDEELDFILNYDCKYRMERDSGKSE